MALAQVESRAVSFLEAQAHRSRRPLPPRQAVMTERNEGVPQDRHMMYRIGINLGDILIEDDDDILGDGVNVAARADRSCRARTRH